MQLFRVRKLLVDTGSVLVHFVHGGVLTVGVLVSLLVAANVGNVPGNFTFAGLFTQASASQSVESQLQEMEPEGVVPPGSQRVIDYLSRRYRVASSAIEPLLDAAQATGARLGLDPLLIVAVMAVESGFNPIAESPLGAKGLMQVIPRFHMDKIDGDESVLLDPLANIQIGALVLHESIRRMGSVERGLQQYAGALGDTDAQYAAKVFGIKQRLEQAMRADTRRAKTAAPASAA